MMLNKILLRLLSAFVFASISLIVLIVCTSHPGTLQVKDFLFQNYTIHVSEAHGYDTTDAEVLNWRAQPHTLWEVTDKKSKNLIYSYCRQLEAYRQLDPAVDIMLGGDMSDFQNFPSICIFTDTIEYNIHLINWNNYADDKYNDWPIKSERYEQPTVIIYRTDFSDPNEYRKSRWYSTLSEDTWNKLLALLNTINEENAEAVKILSP